MELTRFTKSHPQDDKWILVLFSSIVLVVVCPSLIIIVITIQPTRQEYVGHLSGIWTI